MKVLVLANSSDGLYGFRKELLQKLTEKNTVVCSVPDSGHFNDLQAIGCEIITTPIDRRGINPKTDLKLYHTYRSMLKTVRPDLVITYTIKPNVYGGFACRMARIPYLANITGLGTSIENPGLLQKIALTMYRAGVRNASCVFFQNTYNMQFMELHVKSTKKPIAAPLPTGTKVKSKHFGLGTICATGADGVMQIQFPSRKVRFVYPDAFKQGFLVAV